MADAIFLAPFGLYFPLGGGRWSASSAGAVRAGSNAARAIIYGPGWGDGYKLTAFVPIGANGIGKPWCVCLATVPDADTTTLGEIEADPQIIRVPVSPAALDTEFQALAPAVQTAIVNRLEAVRVPADWIQPTTTVRQIVAFILRVIFCAQSLGLDFPELDLTLTVGSLPAARRNIIRNWLAARGVDVAGLNNSSTIREVLARLLQADLVLRLRDLVF